MVVVMMVVVLMVMIMTTMFIVITFLSLNREESIHHQLQIMQSFV